MTERNAILFVHSPRDVASAVKATGELLGYRRRKLSTGRDALLGICCSDLYDPTLQLASPRASNAASDAIEVGETFSLSGIWTLAFLDGVRLADEPCPRTRRKRIVEALVMPVYRASTNALRGTFHTVFTASEPEDAVGDTLSELHQRFTGLMGDLWFVDNPTRGLCGPLVYRGAAPSR
jgi:hypothetical protein